MVDRDKLYFGIFCVAFWVMGVSNFICEEILPFLGENYRDLIQSIVNLLFYLLGIATLRRKKDLGLILVFIGLAIFSSLLNSVPFEFWFNDLRRVIPVLLTLPIVRYFFTCSKSVEFRRSFDKQLLVFLVIQAFCLTFQFLKYGANDHGGGSLGNWNSGNISLSIILISFYFVCKNWDGDNYIKSLWANRWYVFLLFPVFLNETKVSFLVILVYFILLFPFHVKSFGKAFIAVPFAILIGIGGFFFYNWSVDSKVDIFEKDFFVNYLAGGDNFSDIMDSAEEAADFIEELVDKVDQGEWMFLDVPRFMKVGMLIPSMNDAPGGVLFGAGMGHLIDFKHPTKFANDHIVAFFGTRMMIHYIFLPLGILGLIWAFFWYKNILAFRERPFNMSFKVKLMLTFIIILTFFYNEYIQHIFGWAVSGGTAL